METEWSLGQQGDYYLEVWKQGHLCFILAPLFSITVKGRGSMLPAPCPQPSLPVPFLAEAIPTNSIRDPLPTLGLTWG